MTDLSMTMELRRYISDNLTFYYANSSNFAFQECLANCIDQKYDATMTHASYPNHNSYLKSSDFCIVYNKLLKSCQSEKKLILDESYPDLCELLIQNGQKCMVIIIIYCRFEF